MDLDSANAVLRKFIADYNRRFARQPREKETAWRAASANPRSYLLLGARAHG